MWKNKRVKRRSSKKIFIFILFFLSFSGFLLFGLYLNFKRHRLVSPLPSTKSNYSASDKTKGEIKNLLNKNNISFNAITASNSSYFIRLAGGEEVILASEKPLTSQISSLQLVLSRLTIEGKRFIRLDFRFDKPIIDFNQP